MSKRSAGNLDYDVTKEIDFCELCVDGKYLRSSFLKFSGSRSIELFGIVQKDVRGKLVTKSLGGPEYFVAFTDDKSTFVWAYVHKNKGEHFEVHGMENNGREV